MRSFVTECVKQMNGGRLMMISLQKINNIERFSKTIPMSIH